MKAFHNDQEIKDKYIDRVHAHREADRLVRGATGHDGKGCAVACTLDMVYDHSRYPVEMGVPEWLAYVEDRLFEGMSIEKSQAWPEAFLTAIPVGADCERAKTPFIVAVLRSNLRSLAACEFDAEKFPEVRACVDRSTLVVEQTLAAHLGKGDFSSAESAARSAEAAARSAASAAYAAYEASAASAESAARSAEPAAASAESAARSAASAAYAAYEASAASAAEAAASAARSAARSAAYAASAASAAEFDQLADVLLVILRGLSQTELAVTK